MKSSETEFLKLLKKISGENSFGQSKTNSMQVRVLSMG